MNFPGCKTLLVSRTRQGWLVDLLHAEVNLLNFFSSLHLFVAVVRVLAVVGGWRGLGAICLCLPEGRICPGDRLPVYPLGNQQPSSTSRRVASQPRRNGVVHSLQPHKGRCSVGM